MNYKVSVRSLKSTVFQNCNSWQNCFSHNRSEQLSKKYVQFIYFEVEKSKLFFSSSILNKFSNSYNVQIYSFWAGSTKGMRWRSSIQIFIDDQNPEEKIHPPFHNDRYQDQAWDPTFVLHMVGITVGIKWCKNISPITWRIYNVLIN